MRRLSPDNTIEDLLIAAGRRGSKIGKNPVVVDFNYDNGKAVYRFKIEIEELGFNEEGQKELDIKKVS